MIGMTLPVRRRTAAPSWQPFREFEDLYDRMGRLLRGGFPPAGELAETGMWSPLADIEESDDTYTMDLELPGVGKDQITIEAMESQLVVHGEVEEKERKGVLRQRSRRYGRFDYRWSLPADADTDNITAELADGVLSVRIPKTESARRRRRVKIKG
ncbi:Hsp20/alpha crystallin family protein [Streptomyces sp. F63]|uniref:Hsp20/alpha crystallin family protein n=1 Tax=Streptomyces sp. F63 TaxID=2824887 RepID=UPI0027DC674A|nr:Hsp20/alpha crystallin family protein [Streptomyces sp. F63]